MIHVRGTDFRMMLEEKLEGDRIDPEGDILCSAQSMAPMLVLLRNCAWQRGPALDSPLLCQ